MCKVLASFKYLRATMCNRHSRRISFTKRCVTWQACKLLLTLRLGSRTAEKQRPGPLDYALLFREVVRIKKDFGPIRFYPRPVTEGGGGVHKGAQKAWKIKEDVRKLVYNLIRCPDELLQIFKAATDRCRWEHSAFTMGEP